jgi:FtsP/CotA-like multicopper oxidase with cupredoxin domain
MRLKYLKTLFVVLVLLVSCFGTSTAAEYWLRTGAFTKTMPDATVITMWGYALVQYDIGAGVVAGDNVLKVPGPTITVPPGQSLTIHLTNDLTVPTSIIIPSQSATMTPVWADPANFMGASTSTGSRTPGDVTSVVRSLTHETPASLGGVGGIADYIWATIKPGTYLYQSGTHQQVQVQMGLYGLMENDNAIGEAYTGVNYTKDVILLFSEIDPVLHDAVATGTYGTPPAPTSMANYLPKYFLLNGESYSPSTTPPILAGNRGQNILFRFLNAGLKDYVPVFQGLHFNVFAEDGNKLPFPRSQYSLLLPAGKTMDAIITPTVGARIPLYDRRLSLTNNTASPGGLFNYLNIKGEPIVDFNGDVKTDLAVYRSGDWFIYPLGGGTPYGVAWGIATDTPVPGDYDGDGKTDPAVYRDGGWYIYPSGGEAPYSVGWGISTDTPVPGDYDGDGKTDPAVYRDGGWYIYPSGGGAPYSVGWGISTDIPVPGDYDGDGKTDPAVYRDGGWYIYPSGGEAPYSVGWGISTDTPVPGDYDGDGKTDPAVYRNGIWYIFPSGGTAPYGIVHGVSTDIPVPGDYDGDGKTDPAVYRDGTWLIYPSGGGTPYEILWGTSTDIPVVVY